MEEKGKDALEVGPKTDAAEEAQAEAEEGIIVRLFGKVRVQGESF